MIQEVKCEKCGHKEQIHVVNSVCDGSYPGETRSWVCSICYNKNTLPVSRSPIETHKANLPVGVKLPPRSSNGQGVPGKEPETKGKIKKMIDTTDW